METKVVKLEIGKVLAVVIAVAVVAVVAGVVLQSSYFKGELIGAKTNLTEEELVKLKECDFTAEELEKWMSRTDLLDTEMAALEDCVKIVDKEPLDITVDIVEDADVDKTPLDVTVETVEDADVDKTPIDIPVDTEEEVGTIEKTTTDLTVDTEEEVGTIDKTTTLDDLFKK